MIAEISSGDADAARLRLESVGELPILSLTTDEEWIANELLRLGLVPSKAAADALHIGYASVHRMDYLLTWNCRHIANAERLPSIESFLRDRGFAVPKICTPEELMGDVDDVEE